MANILEDTVKFLFDCEHGGQVLADQVTPSIFMVPKAFRDPSPNSFNPKIVSIGPLHRKDEHLQGFEVQKMTYLHDLMKRINSQPEETLRTCAEKVIDSMERIKSCYAGSTAYDNFELAKIMVIDACFILAFILSVWEESSATNMLITYSITYDLLLIENQIPFFILNIIYECTIVASGKMGSAPLTTYIEALLTYYKVFDENLLVSKPNVSLAYTPEHILGYVHNVYQPVKPMPSLITSAPKSRSAAELDWAGIKFKPREDENWAIAMKLELPSPLFSWFPMSMAIPPISWFRSPTLKMRMICIDDYFELIIRNLMIYEQFSNVNKYVTSYVAAINTLTNTPQDVAVLVNSKVLRNYFGSYEEAANMINNLAKDISVPTFYYEKQWEEMDVYYNSYWPNTVAGLKRTYFSNPWSIITVFAAIVLFVLTVVQTIFTVRAA